MSTATLVNNATTVAKLYQAFGRGDIALILDNIDDNCEWIGAGEGSLSAGGTYIGKEAVNFFKRLAETETFESFNPVAIHNITDDEVVAFGDMTAIAKATGKSVTCDWVMHWKFNEDGKAIYFHDFFDTAAAYRANQKTETQETLREEKIKIIESAFENFLKGNIQPIVDLCTDNVEWGAHENSAVPYGKTYLGKQGVSEFFTTMAQNIDYLEFRPYEYYADGDKVFVKGFHKAKVKSTGKTFEHSLLMEFTVKEAKVVSFFAWLDTQDQANAFQS